MENKIAWNNDITALPIGQNTCYRRSISVNFQPPKKVGLEAKKCASRAQVNLQAKAQC